MITTETELSRNKNLVTVASQPRPRKVLKFLETQRKPLMIQKKKLLPKSKNRSTTRDQALQTLPRKK
jgi:hypothetical protein